MDPLSVTASIVAIVQLTFKVSEGLKDAKDASTDRSQFTADISNISKLLYNLLSRLDESSDDPWQKNVRELGEKDGLIYQYRVALEQLKDKMSTGHGIKKIAKTLLWKFIKEDAERIMTRIERLKSLVHIALEMDHLFVLLRECGGDVADMYSTLSQVIESRVSSLQEDSKVVKAGVDTIQRDQDRQRHRVIMDWLSSDDFPAQHSDLIARKQADTGLWFLESPELKAWVHGTDKSKTLLCYGIPGAGKTMMAAITVNHLQNTVQAPDVGVAYLYCNYQRQASQTITNLLMAVLKQLVQNRPSIAQALSSLYDHHHEKNTKPSLQETLKALQSVLSNYSKVYLVVDALDECQDRDGTRSQLIKQCRNLQGQTDTSLMATSRDLPGIVGEFKGMPQVEVRATDADVKRYVVGRIDQLAMCVQDDDDLQELVQTKIVEAVDGMFLLAHLHVESLLGKRTKSKVMSVLNNLSKGSGALKDAYNQVMIRIDGQLPDDCVLAKNVLSWISYAQRPLTIGELCHALAVEPGDEELDTDNILDVKDILSVCAGLVTVDKESQVVRLVHYTTQEYLDGIREKWNPDAQRNIASTCLTYLCFKPFKSGACSSDAEFKKRLRKHKFLDYSARYWGLHIASVQEQLSELAMVLLQDSKLIACVVQVNEGYSSYTLGEANGLHLAASFGLPHLVGKFLSCVVENGIVDINSRDGCGCTALSLAAKNGQEAVVKLLLEREDVEVDSRNDSLGWTVLMEAANECHKDIVKRLLDTGKADVNAQADEEYTALLLVSGKGHVDLVELLLNAGAAVNPQDEEGWSALMGAAFSGDKDVVELLLDAGADINARDMDGSTALSTAVPRGHKDIAELLLNVGADVNAKSGEGQSALMHAVNWEHQDIVELLLDSGAEINAKDEKGRSALMLATDQGDRGLVELLLSSGADINAKDEGGVTALMIAACEGHKDVVELLLNSGADINTKDRDGKTAFSKAVRRRYKDIAELLKKHIGSS